MKKNLLTIGFLAWTFSLGAQTILCHVDANATMYVGKNALVYNGGGLQLKDNAVFENHGNVMVSGNGTTDVVKTVGATGLDKTEANGGGNFINKLNEPTAFASHNSVNPLTSPVYTYGQLFITGVSQTNLTGIVDQEFRQVNHGAYQQIGMPFYDKSFSTLNGELGKVFNTTRFSKNEILVWNNRNVVFDNLASLNLKIGKDFKPFSYYILGGTGLNVETTRTFKGRPVSDAADIDKKITLENAGSGIVFGPTGGATNQYNERYNTYLQDNFSVSGGQAWQGDFGRNIYQFGNPYLTNLDFSQVAVTESATTGDGNNLSNIYGIRLEVSGVQYNSNLGGGSSNYKAITFDASGVAIGDVEYQVVRPLGSFAIKLKDNITKPELNFATLRRFKYHPRSGSANYSVSAARGGSSSTVKQLGVIGLDANGNELERTYYVVSGSTVTGASTNVTAQVGAFGGAQLGTYEESITGGYDNNNVSYWLYVNEANENDFGGKNIKLVNYNPNIVQFKFEIRENAALVPDQTHLLSQGEGFYYKKASDATEMPALQNQTISLSGSTPAEYDLYYGRPQTTLATSITKKSSTIVVFNPEKDNYFVLIDPTWKNAEIQVFDMSGKLVNDIVKVSSKDRYELPLRSINAGYIVHITSDKGEKVVTKILR